MTRMDATFEEFRRHCAGFVDRHVVPFAGEWDRLEALPRNIITAAADAGYLGRPYGTAHGPDEMEALAILHEEVGRGCSSLRSLFTVQGMVGRSLKRWAGPETAARWLDRLADGTAIAAFAVSEDGAGSDLSAIRTRLERTGGHLVLTGCKRWISFGEIADCVLVLAITDEGPSTVLVETSAHGVSLRPLHGMLGAKASHLADITFDKVELDPSALLGRAGAGLRIVVSQALDFGRLSVACGCVGLARACVETALAHVAQRDRAGGPLLRHQLVRRHITQMLAGMETARLLCRRAARMSGQGDPNSVSATALAKYHAARTAMQNAWTTVQLLGAEGCAPTSPAERFFRDAKVMEIIEGTTEMHETTLADYALREFHPLLGSGP
jgi:alkylation response protein AidB-like acyl-CoA dehydrogenase